MHPPRISQQTRHSTHIHTHTYTHIRTHKHKKMHTHTHKISLTHTLAHVLIHMQIPPRPQVCINVNTPRNSAHNCTTTHTHTYAHARTHPHTHTYNTPGQSKHNCTTTQTHNTHARTHARTHENTQKHIHIYEYVHVHVCLYLTVCVCGFICIVVYVYLLSPPLLTSICTPGGHQGSDRRHSREALARSRTGQERQEKVKTKDTLGVFGSVLQFVAVRCSALQYVAVPRTHSCEALARP